MGSGIAEFSSLAPGRNVLQYCHNRANHNAANYKSERVGVSEGSKLDLLWFLKGNLEGKTFYDVNAVCPSIIDTSVNRADMPDFDWDNESVKCEDIAERIVGEWWLGDQHIMNE